MFRKQRDRGCIQIIEIFMLVYGVRKSVAGTATLFQCYKNQQQFFVMSKAVEENNKFGSCMVTK